jgi:hypothetical protein
MLEKLLKRKESLGFLFFIIGFGIVVMILHRPFETERVLAVSPEELEGAEVKVEGKCYKYRVEDARCQITSLK